MNIRPGLSARIVTEIDPARDKIRVGNSVVYDVREPTIILAQTDPPVPKSMFEKEIVVTYLVKEKGDMVRYGFPVRIAEFIDYTLSAGGQVKAISARIAGEAAPYSIRMFFRVNPTEQSRLRMSILGNRVNILDISLGGVRFSYKGPLALEAGEIVAVRLDIDGRYHRLEACILRNWTGEEQGMIPRLAFATAEFLDMSNVTDHALSRKIRSIERESLAREALP